MLTASQKYSIASTLSTSSLETYIGKVKNLPEYKDAKLFRDFADQAIEFATKIDKLYVKKDGFVPKRVVELCK